MGRSIQEWGSIAAELVDYLFTNYRSIAAVVGFLIGVGGVTTFFVLVIGIGGMGMFDAIVHCADSWFNTMRKYVAIVLVFWGVVLDLILLGGMPLMGHCEAFGSLIKIVPCDATKLDGLLMLYVFLLSGIIRIYAGLYPNHTGCWQAGMLSMVFEIVLTYQAYAIKGEVDFSDGAFILCGITFILMLITYPSSSGSGEKDKSN